jgi:EAL domain-containing protein (putative c-di-GMP-specific phosphodiesterase class I)
VVDAPFVEKPAVLVVDDDPRLLRVLRRGLEGGGCAVTAVSTSDAAIAALAEGSFDVLISDINLDGVSGLNLLADVRERHGDLPVILLTGGGSLTSAIRAIELGAFRYLLKPMEEGELLAAVKIATQHHRLARLRAEAFDLGRQGALGATSRASLAVHLDRAIATLRLHFQPIVDARAKTVFGYEALMRSSEETLPHPGALLEAARLLGRSLELGRAIRSKAAEALAANESLELFVNLDVADLVDPELISGTSEFCRFAKRVVLEITERQSLDAVSDLLGRIRALRAQGFRLAVDDLGAGYSGLTSLVQLQPEYVKLDMSLIRDVDTHLPKQKLVRSMVQLCKEMGMRVIAEGVETTLERATLLDLDCLLLQGYFFARPGPAFPDVRWTT